jgi:DNA-binding beta-propeller fold protein YncE
VTHPEHTAKQKPFTEANRFAALRAFLRGQGSSAPSTRALSSIPAEAAEGAQGGAGKGRSEGVCSAHDRMSTRACAALCGALAFLAFTALAPSAASADQTRLLVNHFGTLNNPTAIAIDQTSGDVYVADTANHRIEKFDSAGNLLLAFGADVGGPGIDTCTSACQPGTAGSEPGAFEGTFEGFNSHETESRLFLAVDNDAASPSFHDVYVGDPGDNLVSKFDSAGNLISTWGNNGLGGTANGQLAGNGSETFRELDGIAFSASGTLDVFAISEAEQGEAIPFGHVFEFEADGTFISAVALAELSGGLFPRGLAVDATGNFLKVNANGSVEKISPAGADLGTVTVGFHTAALSIEPASGDLYVVTLDEKLDHYAFNGAGEVEEPGGSPCPITPTSHGCAPTDSVALPFAPTGIDVSSASGDAYLSDPAANRVDVYEEATIPHAATEAATEVGAHEATLNGTVNPAGIQVTECFFQWGTEAGVYGHTAQCEPEAAAIAPNEADHPVEAKITGLKAGTAYHFRLIAANAKDAGAVPNPGADKTLNTSPPPSIDEALATEITATSATLTTKVNPHGFATSCQIEWGATAEPGNPALPYEHAEPCQPEALGSGTADVPASLHLESLSAGTSYHWRVIATNANEPAQSSEHTFVYLVPHTEGPCPSNEALRAESNSLFLPDCRAYEQVTPTRKNGALIGNISFVGIQPDLAANGERVIAGSIQCFAGATSCNAQHGDGVGSPYSFARTAGGWQTTPLAPPATQFAPATTWAYGADSGAALFSMSTPPQGEDDFYLRRPSDGSFLDIGPNTPPEQGAQGPKGGGPGGGKWAITADLSHFVWPTPARWPFDATAGEGAASVYEYAGAANQPLLVGVGGPNDGPGSTDLISACGTELGVNSNSNQPGQLSADGRIVFFTAGACATGSGANAGVPVPAATLYARVEGELPTAHTVLISAPSPSECGSGGAPDEIACRAAAAKPADARFEGASADGTLAYFTSTQQLTDDASEDSAGGDSAYQGSGCSTTTGPGGCNLYLYDSAQPAGHHLTAVSAAAAPGAEPRVQGVIALSPDGSHVYFVAQGVLAANPGANGEEAMAGADNLYVYQRDAAHPAGQLAFIAALPASDSREWNVNPGLPANVTPDGRFLLFVSHGALTPDETSRSGAKQVFRYDATEEELDRVSIGARGFNDNGNRSTATPCNLANDCSEDATIVPGNTGFASRTNPSISNDGSRAFFTSPLALTPGALDDQPIGAEEGAPIYAQNVYEWQADGTEVDGRITCEEASGCVSLISDGRDTSLNRGTSITCTPGGGTPSSTCLLGADASGENVFFTTTSQLVPSDTDTALDYYDARINGGFAKPAAPQICLTADACHGQGTEAGPQPSPATPGFNGPGNLHETKCKKGFVKKRGKCVKKQVRKHRHKKRHHSSGRG